MRKMRLISKFTTSQAGKHVIAIQISPNISVTKNNQTMKFGRLMEYNMRNISLEKLYMLEKLFADPFLKNQNCAYLD